MSGRKSSIVIGALLAMCCMLPAAWADPLQPDASKANAPAPELPAFLDSKRLIDLQEAWRTRERGAAHAAKPAAAEEPAPDSQQAISAVRAAMKRVDEASREADAVRLKAEELSQRFGEGGNAAQAEAAQPVVPTPPPYAVGGDPSADRSKTELPPEVEAPAHVGAPAPTVPPLGADTTTAAIPDAAQVPEATPPPPKAKHGAHIGVGIPPLPVRAPKVVAKGSHRPSGATSPRRSRPAVAARVVVPDVRNGRGEVFPPYLGAYEWKSQPQLIGR